jgi:IS4 transposase
MNKGTKKSTFKQVFSVLSQFKQRFEEMNADTEGKLVMILTNDFLRSSQEIGDLYRYRWQIELFFKWIKQHLTVKHLYGEGMQAVENQIFMALITYCLLMLLKVETGFTGTLLTIQRLLKTCLLEPFDTFLQKLFREKRRSKGRRKIDHGMELYN